LQFAAASSFQFRVHFLTQHVFVRDPSCAIMRVRTANKNQFRLQRKKEKRNIPVSKATQSNQRHRKTDN
jgi:hypothetical protein